MCRRERLSVYVAWMCRRKETRWKCCMTSSSMISPCEMRAGAGDLKSTNHDGVDMASKSETNSTLDDYQ